MSPRRMSPVALTLTAFAWLNFASTISLHAIVSFADASQSPCHDSPCETSESDLYYGSGTPDLSNNDHDNPPRKLESAAYESYFNNEVETWLNKRRTKIENSVFISYDPQGYAYQSTAYQYDDFIDSLRSMSVTGVGGGNEQVYFNIGQTDDKGVVHGLVNVAAFLAHAMAVSIRYDVCDEFNMDATDFTRKYAISNSCGQYGHSYQDEVCAGEEEFMTCDVDPELSITAADSLSGDNAPPPLTCGPKESATDFTGHWDAELGVLGETYPYANRKGVLHHEGCCWWGRGVLMTRGTCNFGKLNHFLGRQAAAQGWVNFYDVDLCVYPEVVCEGHDTRGLRWSVGYFEWLNRVETYQNPTAGVDYMKDLDTLIATGFVDINGFIDIVGMALPYNCVESNCLAEEERVRQERRDNFLNLVYNVFDLPYLFQATPFPTPPPTNKPTQDSTMPPTVRQPGQPSPTKLPTSKPIQLTTAPPTKLPTTRPSVRPTQFPTAKPTLPPTKLPTGKPTAPAMQIPANTPPEFPVTRPPASRPTAAQALPPQTVLLEICIGQSASSIPINGCEEYVQCLDGNIVGITPCPSGLIFDARLGICNWAFGVDCDAPSRRPTPEPTRQTPRPTPRTPKPTQQPLESIGVGQIDLSPDVPQQPPTPSPPFPGSIPLPISTQPPFGNQRPIGQSSNGGSDEQGEESYRPTYTPKPTFDFMDLIDLPSGASLGGRGNPVFLPVGILLMAIGSFMFWT